MSNITIGIVIGLIALAFAAKEIESLKDRISELEDKLDKYPPKDVDDEYST